MYAVGSAVNMDKIVYNFVHIYCRTNPFCTILSIFTVHTTVSIFTAKPILFTHFCPYLILQNQSFLPEKRVKFSHKKRHFKTIYYVTSFV